MPRLASVIVFDTNSLKYLESLKDWTRVANGLRAARLEVRLSAVNVLEIVKTENARVRSRLLGTVATVLGGSHILPEPSTLLRLTAESLMEGKSGFFAPPSGLEWLVREPERIEAKHIEDARRTIAANDAVWEEAHREARKQLRRRVRAEHGHDPWGSVEAFLDQQWSRVDQLDTLMQSTWRTLGLPGDAPVRILLANEVWRMYFEALGAIIYERTIPSQLPRPAHMSDVFQLVYLSGAARRLLVTEDQGFARLASAVLLGRYPLSRVLLPSDLLDLAG